MTSFWDTPDNHPPAGSWPQPGGPPVEGTITRMAVLRSRFGRDSLCLELDGDGVQRWCGTRLWRALAELRVEIGQRVRVTRLADEPGTMPGQRPAAMWRVERVTAPAAAPTSWGPPPSPPQPTWTPDPPQASTWPADKPQW